MLKVTNLSITYPGPVQAVQELSFSLETGRTTVLLGQSGSGKSSVGLAICGLLPPGTQTEGTVALTDSLKEPVGLLEGTHPSVAWVAQGAQQALSPTRTIRSLLLESIGMHQPGTDAIGLANSLMADLDLESAVLDAYPHQLSGGQRQRCLFALALTKKPKILVADEPTTSLDVVSANLLTNLLVRISGQEGLCILLITHDLRLAARLDTHTLVMASGQLVADGKFHDLVQQPDSLPGQLWQQWTQVPPASQISLQVPLVRIQDLTVKYEARGKLFQTRKKVSALNGISLSIRQGESLGLMGESGSGKSTLGKALCELIPFGGQIHWEEVDADRFQQVQIILQDSFSSLHPRFSVGKTLREVLRIHAPKQPRKAYQAMAAEALTSVRLPETYLSRYPAQLSGGERQRVAIARSLISRPHLLILDESVTSLDATLQDDILELIASLAEAHNMALLVISHDFRIIRKLCQTAVVLRSGQVVEQFSIQDPVESLQPYTRSLIKAADWLLPDEHS